MRPVAFALLIALSLSLYSCSEEFEPAEQIGTTPIDENPDPTDPTNPGQTVFGQPIIKNSELYVYLTRATHNSGDQMTDIICINFVYPFVLKKFDASMNVIETVTLENDPQFYNYLLALQPTQSVSLSYPISTIGSNGDLLSVNNNAELLDALKECSEAAVIGYCNGVFAGDTPEEQEVCSWRVAYYPGADNTYAGGIFLANEDGTLTFNYDGQNYPGTWVFLFVNGEPHMNISLEGTSATANYWNIDREIYVNDDHIVIYTSPMNIRLERYCGTTATYAIGDTGPGNGIVFYDKGQYSDGWRYMEITANDLPTVQWGCLGSLTSSVAPSLNGLLNSIRIANFHDTTGFYQNPQACNSANDGTVAARSALSWQNAGITDWYLPSEQEMQLVYTNLAAAGLSTFSANQYWTSNEESTTTARAVNLNNGTTSAQQKTATGVKTRAIRMF